MPSQLLTDKGQPHSCGLTRQNQLKDLAWRDHEYHILVFEDQTQKYSDLFYANDLSRAAKSAGLGQYGIAYKHAMISEI